MLVKISWLCSLLAVSLLVWSGLCLICSGDSRQNGDALIVEETEQDLGEQTPGTHTLELRIRNTSSQARRVIGVTGH